MNIPSVADLSQAIETFSQNIQPLLELGDISNWDGAFLKERESEIRNLALVLAGHCIALLLLKLSHDQAAQEEARKRTQSSRGFQSRSQGKQPLKILTIGNVEVVLSVSYILSRPSQSTQRKRENQARKRGKSKGQGFYPLLRWLGIEEQVSPLVWSMVASAGMLSVSFSSAQQQLKDWGIALSEKRIERLTYCFGSIGINLTQQWVEQLQAGQLATGETFRDHRVVISVDGGRTRLRRNKKGKRRATKRHGYYGDWREPKLLTLYAINEQGERIHTIEVPIINDGTFAGIEVFMPLLEAYCVKLGIIHAQQVLLVADGALWIWQRIPALLKRLGLPTQRLMELLDFYHACSQLKEFAEAAFKKTQHVQQWFKFARSSLRRGKLEQLLLRMQQLIDQKHSKKKQETLTQVFNYFNNQDERFDYPGVKAKNFPIGSGAIESLIRQVVNQRLKGNGKFWLPEHAEILLHGRCQWAAHAWDNYCHNVLTARLDSKRLAILNNKDVSLAAA